jgi:hypothetical protein
MDTKTMAMSREAWNTVGSRTVLATQDGYEGATEYRIVTNLTIKIEEKAQLPDDVEARVGTDGRVYLQSQDRTQDEIKQVMAEQIELELDEHELRVTKRAVTKAIDQNRITPSRAVLEILDCFDL